MDIHNPYYFFHTFSIPEWNFITSFGKRGEGPQKMLSADYFRFISTDSIWTLDSNKTRITIWKYESNTRKITPIENIDMDKRLVKTLYFYPIDSGFLVSDYLGEYRQKWMDNQGVWTRSSNQIPTEKTFDAISRPVLAQAWRSFIDYNPTKNILVMSTQPGEVLEIYNLRDNSYIIKYRPNGEPIFRISQSEGIPLDIMVFSNIHITDNFIYAVFHGRKFKNIKRALQNGERIEDGGRFIYVFNLNGTLIRKYILDRAIYGIDINEKTNTITATDVNSNAPIIQFKM